MKRFFPILTLAVIVLFPVLVVKADDAPTPFAIPTKIPETDLESFLGKIFDALFTALMFAGAIFLVVAGYLYISAAGDPDKIKKATHSFIYCLIAIAVGVLSKMIVVAISTALG